MSEYLKGFRTKRIEGLTVPDMLQTGRVLSPGTLSLELQDAYRHLVGETGPHLSERQQHAEGWLPWWINYLNSLPSPEAGLMPSPKIVPLPEIRADRQAGVLFVAGAEGHEGHRFAAHWMKTHVPRTVWMFEEDDYLKRKQRGGSFLPLEVRLSMWSHHPDVDIVSVTPLAGREGYDDLDGYYRHIFGLTGAGYCFATEEDPHEESKRSRGLAAFFTRIPAIPTPSTTERVMRLIPSENDKESLEDALFALQEAAFPWKIYEEFKARDTNYV